MTVPMQTSAPSQLRQMVEQIERLGEEKAALAADIRDKFLEAKALGFDIKTLRQVLRLRRVSQTERTQADAILTAYLQALGMLAETPLGTWAAEQARAAASLAAMHRADGGGEPSVSIDGGPYHPMSEVRAAIGIVKASRAAGKAEAAS